MNRRFARARLFVGVGAVVVLVAVIVGAFALGMFPLLGDAAIAPMRSVPDRDLESVSGRIAFVLGGLGDGEIYVMNVDGSGFEQLTDNNSDDRDPAWSPDGSRIVFTSDRDNGLKSYDIYVMNADGSDVEQLTDSCSNNAPAWLPDGGRIAFSSRGDIYVMNADGSGVEQLTGTFRTSCSELFVSVRDGEPEWYLRKADGSLELFTDYESMNWESVDSGPEWSPDGSRIALQSIRDGEFGVYVMNADGSGLEQPNENDGRYVWGVAWSSVGHIAFSSRGDDDDTEVYVMNADGSGVVRLTDNEHSDVEPAWSPDGNRIAFTSGRDGDAGIYVMNADGSGVVRLAEGHSPAWSPLLE